MDPHVSDRWCVKQSDATRWSVPESCPDVDQVDQGPFISPPLSRPIPLIALESSVGNLAPWQQWLSEFAFQTPQVRELSDFLLNLQPWPDTAFSTTWQHIPDRHEYIDLISSLEPVPGPVGDFHVFLDGSYFPRTGLSAWSFSVLLRDARGNYFRWGFTGDLASPGSGSLHAEAEAFAYALDWVISSLSGTSRPVHFYGDATAIGFGADGKQNIAKGLDDLGRLARNLFCIAQSAMTHVYYHHVKAHSGQIDNELVDSVAKAIARQQWSPHTRIPPRSRWDYAPLLQWAWLLIEKAQPTQTSLPSLDDLASGQSFPSIPQCNTDPFGIKPEVAIDQPTMEVSLKLGSANVRSLKEGACYNGFHDKLGLIAMQFQSHGYDLLSLQETRAKSDRVASFNGISRLIAAADCGQGGVELWINPEGTLSRAGCGPLSVQHFHVRASSSTWHGSLQTVIIHFFSAFSLLLMLRRQDGRMLTLTNGGRISPTTCCLSRTKTLSSWAISTRRDWEPCLGRWKSSWWTHEIPHWRPQRVPSFYVQPSPFRVVNHFSRPFGWKVAGRLHWDPSFVDARSAILFCWPSLRPYVRWLWSLRGCIGSTDADQAHLQPFQTQKGPIWPPGRQIWSWSP